MSEIVNRRISLSYLCHTNNQQLVYKKFELNREKLNKSLICDFCLQIQLANLVAPGFQAVQYLLGTAITLI